MPLQLGDYAADGDWFFIVACRDCGRQALLKPRDLLAREGKGIIHRGMHIKDIEALLRCRECRRKRARLEPVARVRKQAFLAGLI